MSLKGVGFGKKKKKKKQHFNLDLRKKETTCGKAFQNQYALKSQRMDLQATKTWKHVKIKRIVFVV